jgi:hypothetical protein
MYRNSKGVLGRGLGQSYLGALVSAMVTASAVAAPNMVVRIDGQIVENHQEIVFADTAVGASSQIVVTLRNESSETLTFTEDPAITMAGGFPEHFELIQPALEAGGVLSPNGSTAFAVHFQPEFRFTRLFTHVYIWTNAEGSPFHLIFSGRAAGPKMVVKYSGTEIADLEELELPDTPVGATLELELSIENQGDGTLELTGDPRALIAGGLGEFVMSVTQQPDATVAPGAATSVRLAFTPEEERFYSTRMFVSCNQNDGDVNGLYDIDIVARGVAPSASEGPAEPEPTSDEEAGDTGAPPEDDPNQAGQPIPDDDAGLEDEGNVDLDDMESDAEEAIDLVDDEFLLGTGGLCGFGAGFASMASMVSLGGGRYVHRRRRR